MVLSAAIVLLILIRLVTVINYTSWNETTSKKPFYVGVTFCGNNTQEAKMLIDKVKNYTNLFVLQSGPLMVDTNAVNEIGDYAVANGLHFAVYLDTSSPTQNAFWVGTAEQRWGSMFAGVYYGDEPGGKMLDAYVHLAVPVATATNETMPAGNYSSNFAKSVIKLKSGGIQYGDVTYFPNGTITVRNSTSPVPDPSFWKDPSSNADPDIFEANQTQTIITYYPNGSITIEESFTLITYYSNGSPTVQGRGRAFFTMENGTDPISQVESYEQVLSKDPIPNCASAAETFVNRNQKTLEDLRRQWQLINRSFPLFTSDYALYWWDYQSGYDLVLAQLGWNNTVAQEIGLVRGAANLQGKSWGTIITWKYTQQPYLTSGEEMYNQMRTSYECGAEYVVVFNYAEDMEGPYGTLQEEHFQALERFWSEVVQNPNVIHGGVKAEAALVLPKNYGWGMRNSKDIIWGIWGTNSTSEQIWTQLQSKLVQYGSRLDIVYDDPAYPVAGKYGQIFYWNQTS
jgi:hypothetical protein